MGLLRNYTAKPLAIVSQHTTQTVAISGHDSEVQPGCWSDPQSPPATVTAAYSTSFICYRCYFSKSVTGGCGRLT